jgi:hypothetical protein
MQKLEQLGWLLFVAGSAVFVAVGVVNGDLLTLTGGLLYLVGCMALLKSSQLGGQS